MCILDFSPRGSYQLWVVSTTKQNIMEEYIKHIDENIIYDGKTIVLGIPFDDRSSYLKGASKGPEAIRKALNSSSGNLATESGYDLGSSDGWHDMGNIDDMQSNNNAFSIIEGRLNEYLNQGARIVTLGGDHSITLPIIRAYGKNIRPLDIMQIDAHPDLYDELDGDRESHACPFSRIMEENLVERLVQVGIRTMNPHQKKQSDRFGTEVITMREWNSGLNFEFSNPVYLSIDMDCLDPGFAPGVSHYEPGGLTPRDVITMIQNMKGDIIGADIVELNPKRDHHGMTAFIGAKFLKEILDRMLNG